LARSLGPEYLLHPRTGASGPPGPIPAAESKEPQAMTPRPAALLLAFLPLVLTGCQDPGPAPEAATETAPEATSLLGEPLYRPPIDAEALQRMEAQLAEARADHEANPRDADAIIWFGRRLAYPARYRDAVEAFSEGIPLHPDDARMYRHRGHRYITLRRLDDAIRDLERAAELTRGEPDEIEPDGMPNPFGIPTSTLQSNIWYHLALARYLKHDFEGALEAWRQCMEVSATDDMRVATADWLYMTLRRLGRDAEAASVLDPFHADMEILENQAYHRRLLMYRGELTPEEILAVDDQDPVQVATYGYGVANWYLYNGDEERAFQLFERILEGPNWAAFGYIAAEAELAHRR
jgi:tetratricopeptide (TPR) repeat protein